MSAAKNPDSVTNQGEFHSRVAPSEPLEKGGHKPGVLASPNDHAPEFSAQTLPAGTAPASSTYTPNPDLNNQGMYQSASSTLTGADSASVHTGLGHPGSGMTSQELHDGSRGKGQGRGLVGTGARVRNKGEVVMGGIRILRIRGRSRRMCPRGSGGMWEGRRRRRGCRRMRIRWRGR